MLLFSYFCKSGTGLYVSWEDGAVSSFSCRPPWAPKHVEGPSCLRGHAASVPRARAVGARRFLCPVGLSRCCGELGWGCSHCPQSSGEYCVPFLFLQVGIHFLSNVL